MKIESIFVLFALSAIAEGQFAAAARGLYQPVILSVGAAFAFFSDKSEVDGQKWHEYAGNKFSKKIDTILKEEYEKKEKATEHLTSDQT